MPTLFSRATRARSVVALATVAWIGSSTIACGADVEQSGPAGSSTDVATDQLYAVADRHDVIVMRGVVELSRTPAELVGLNDLMRFTEDSRFVIWTEGAGNDRVVVAITAGTDSQVVRIPCRCSRVVPIGGSKVAWIDAPVDPSEPDVLRSADLAESTGPSVWRTLETVPSPSQPGERWNRNHVMLGSRGNRVLIGHTESQVGSDAVKHEVFAISTDGEIAQYGPVPDVGGYLRSGVFDPRGEAVAVLADNTVDPRCRQAVVAVSGSHGTGFRTAVPQDSGCTSAQSIDWNSDRPSVVVRYRSTDDAQGADAGFQRWQYSTVWQEMPAPVFTVHTRDKSTLTLEPGDSPTSLSATFSAGGKHTVVAQGVRTIAVPE
ncbi:hypothetical protein ACFVAV_07545 [Nocardia sp. NPDC057663]|uniref:hypothetical protein n=1 Tax=Nocardia sp. NPDC057663 TaxID=3346201 RepID=UPI003672EE21